MCRKTNNEEKMNIDTNLNQIAARAIGVSDDQLSRHGDTKRPIKCCEGGKRRPEAAREL